jgi:exodeoxyribonuclease V alpha subunit
MREAGREGPSVEGTVQTIRYSNADTFWTVAVLKTPKGDVNLVGALPGLAEGMNVRLEGRFEENARFGRQFKADRFTELVPATVEGLERYLASGFIAGIGDKLASRIVETFGTATIEVIVNSPGRLDEVPGLGKKRAQALQDAFRERRGAQDALVFLLGLGIARGLAMRILKRYGDDTVAAVRRNPYKLAQEVHGIGFIKADQVAAGLDIAQDHPERIRAGLIHTLREARDEGHVRLGRPTLLRHAETLLGVSPDKILPILDELAHDGRVVLAPPDGTGPDPLDPQVYLATLFEAEQGAAWHIARLASVARPPKTPVARVEAASARLGIALAPGQRDAVLLALDHPVVIVTGGPGTGKTTIIRTLLEASTFPEGRIALAAPTGRAAKRMAEATNRTSSTLHRLLEFNPGEGAFGRDELNPIAADLVIIDEASMVDLPLFYSLVRALADGCRLVLVGDRDQLPPVGPGSPLTDLIALGKVPVARLTEIYRQGKNSAIVEAAHDMNSGRPVAPTPNGQPLQDFYFIAREEPDQIRQLVESLVKTRIPERFGLDPVRDIQVLSPMRMGPIGVEALNQALQQLLNPLPPEPDGFRLEGETRQSPFRVGDKVMQIRNDYERGVFNGDLGFVRAFDRGQLHVEVDDKLVTYERDAWDDLVLAYAVTVHKSQGSEYPAVIVPVSTQHFKMLRRNLLYTAVTRGKRLVVLIGTEKAMRIAVSNQTVEERHSGLQAAVKKALDEGRETLGFTPKASVPMDEA